MSTNLDLLTTVSRIQMLFEASIAAQAALEQALKEIEDGKIPDVDPGIAMHYRALLSGSVPESERLQHQTPVPAAGSSTPVSSPRSDAPVETDSATEANPRKRKSPDDEGVVSDSPTGLRRSKRVINQNRLKKMDTNVAPTPDAPASQGRLSKKKTLGDIENTVINRALPSSQIRAPREDKKGLGEDFSSKFKFKLTNMAGPGAVPFGWAPQS